MSAPERIPHPIVLVEAVIAGWESYHAAIAAAMAKMPPDDAAWEKVAAICQENARAWEALAAMYRGTY